MTEGTVIEIARMAITEVLKISGPILGVSLVVGLVVSILQATTSIQEQTLTFVPKIVAIFVTILILGSFFIKDLVEFTARIFSLIPGMVK